MYYLLLVIAWVLGQIFYTSVSVWRIQKDLPIDYWTAAKAYCKKEIGSFIMSASLMCIAVFILPELINIHMSKNDILSKAARTKIETAQLYFRSVATVIGAFSQHIAYMLYKRGKKAVIDESKKMGVDEG